MRILYYEKGNCATADIFFSFLPASDVLWKNIFPYMLQYRHMSEYVVKGGRKLEGSVRISGNKNAALPCLAATLLTDESVTLENVPSIQDVNVMLRLLGELGSQVSGLGDGMYALKSDIAICALTPSLVDSVRGSILFAGPLLARGYKVVIPPPGGDVIGLRRLDSHFIGLSALGVKCEINSLSNLEMTPPGRLKAADIFLDEASVTATENCIMAASLADGTSTIYNAACEPHVQNLCHMLNSMGCEITGIGSNFLTIKGKESLHGCRHRLCFDYMECGSFIGLAACTYSALTLTGIDDDGMKPVEKGFRKLGIEFETGRNEIHVPRNMSRVIARTYTGVTEKIDDAPWPGFPADLLSIMCVTATQMEGSILIHEKMFESRMFFIDYLIRMGADIILCDPHRAVVRGRTRLKGREVISPDVRAGMALVVAALCAEGESVISNIEQIERGYEHLLDKLVNIGADIRRI